LRLNDRTIYTRLSIPNVTFRLALSSVKKKGKKEGKKGGRKKKRKKEKG
jgi:hypothetical protein